MGLKINYILAEKKWLWNEESVSLTLVPLSQTLTQCELIHVNSKRHNCTYKPKRLRRPLNIIEEVWKWKWNFTNWKGEHRNCFISANIWSGKSSWKYLPTNFPTNRVRSRQPSLACLRVLASNGGRIRGGIWRQRWARARYVRWSNNNNSNSSDNMIARVVDGMFGKRKSA